jgi:hypothetical protein
LVNYDAYDSAARDAILAQQHTDIRVFDDGTTTTAQTVAGLSTLTGTQLNALTMTTINNPSTLIAAEGWTPSSNPGSFAYGRDPANNNMRRLVIPYSVGADQTHSHMPNNPVDLSGYAPTDFISISMPNLPFSSFRTDSTYIDFSSHPDGETAGVDPWVTKVLFMQASVTTLTNGHSEARIPISALLSAQLRRAIIPDCMALIPATEYTAGRSR